MNTTTDTRVPPENLPAKISPNEIVEMVLIKGDLGKLTPGERTNYYKAVCDSVGLNALTKPFEYITLNGKLQLYALKACTDQLRSIYDISVTDLTKETVEGVHIVTAKVQNAKGRTDADIGAVNIAGLKGEAFANAIMKASTKAKRRATLSICGLGMLDETEVEDIPRAQVRVPSPSEVQVIAPQAEVTVVTPKHQKPRAIVPEENDTFEKWTARYLAGLEGAKSLAELKEWDELNDAPLGTISNKSKPHYNRIMNRHEELINKFQHDPISSGPAVPPAPKAAKSPNTEGCPDSRKEPDKFLTWATAKLSSMESAEQLSIYWENVIEPAADGLFPPDFEELQSLLRQAEKRLGA
jgi:hypothetical protein